MKTTRSKDGTTLAYDVYGSGPPLIYITGASCFRSFKPVLKDAKAFAKEFTVFNYDRRGRGDSDNTLPYAIDREIEDVEAMIDAAGGTAYLYGHSSGAVLALEAAMRLGRKVKKVAMYDAPYLHDETEKAEYLQLGRNVCQLLEQGKNSEAIRSFFKGIGIPKIFVFFIRLTPDWPTMVALAPTLAYDIAMTSGPPPVDRASRVTVPVQVMAGEKSPSDMHTVGSQLASAIPNAGFVQLADQDHLVDAKALLPVLSRFFKADTAHG